MFSDHRWRYAYRWGGLDVMSVHRMTPAGWLLLRAVCYEAVPRLLRARGASGRLRPAVSGWSKLARWLRGVGPGPRYELSGFVMTAPYRDEFPEVAPDEPAFAASVEQVFRDLDVFRSVPRPTTARIHRV